MGIGGIFWVEPLLRSFVNMFCSDLWFWGFAGLGLRCKVVLGLGLCLCRIFGIFGGSILKTFFVLIFVMVWFREPKAPPQRGGIWREASYPVRGSMLFGQFRPQSCQIVYSPACLPAPPPPARAGEYAFWTFQAPKLPDCVLPRVLTCFPPFFGGFKPQSYSPACLCSPCSTLFKPQSCQIARCKVVFLGFSPPSQGEHNIP